MIKITGIALASLLTSAQIQEPPKDKLTGESKSLCGVYEEMKKFLLKEYGELPFIDMITTRYGAQLQMFANPKTGTWTVIAVDIAENKACLIDTGLNLMPSESDKSNL